ncbi:MAG: ATP-binding protein [Thiomicrorhabdus sp.]|jgi:CheY-like chemotaxis protein|nr:ATP-binding protein [Thiomicrorhabdus sp.]
MVISASQDIIQHQSIQLLLIGSDKNSEEFLRTILEEEGFQLTFVKSSAAAQQLIFEKPAAFYNAYLFDESHNHQQTLQNLKLLQALKNDSQYAIVPAIFQTNSHDTREIQHCLENGAYFYLLKPFTKDLLLSVLNAALTGFTSHQELTQRITDIENMRPLVQQAHFQIKTVDDARSLSSVLAYITPAPKETSVGLFELMLNAIEHSNLNISYLEKTELIKTGGLQKEIARRLALAENCEKRVTVIFNRTSENLEFTISDTGNGFDPLAYLDFSIERAMDNHGRGIMIANKLSFNELEYQDNGSKVTARIHLT